MSRAIRCDLIEKIRQHQIPAAAQQLAHVIAPMATAFRTADLDAQIFRKVRQDLGTVARHG